VAEDDERRLLDRCLAGDEDACAALVDAYARMAGTVIWRATGDQDLLEDLAQETFLRVFRALPSFDRRAKLSTWIYTIAHRVAIDHLRKAGRWQEQSFAVAEDEPAAAVDLLSAPALVRPDTLLARSEDVRLVRAALARLPDKYRVPLVYAAIDELDYPTIAGMLGVTVGAVKTLVFRGKRMLKDEIGRAR
jgi:RNA polymerase sigma-70 factor, ECF subfamily